MAKTYVMISVDVEDPLSIKTIWNDQVDETKSSIYGKINNQHFGFSKIIEICNEFNTKATFFLDVFEYKRYGEKTFRDICQEIIKNGQDVQLHIHPSRGYDEKRRFMTQYSLKEQIQLIGEGRELIKKWIGEYPVAYRGGNYYSINKDTLTALRETKIPIDSTMFYGRPECKVIFSKNKTVEKYGVIEVPITVFLRRNYIWFGPFRLKSKSSYIKTDIDWATLDELKFFVREAKNHNVKVMNLFMHSYSFLKFNKDFTEFKPDYNDIKKFEGFLKFIKKDKDIQVITMKEFYNLYKENPNEFIGSDYVPVYLKPITFKQVMKNLDRRIKSKI